MPAVTCPISQPTLARGKFARSRLVFIPILLLDSEVSEQVESCNPVDITLPEDANPVAREGNPSSSCDLQHVISDVSKEATETSVSSASMDSMTANAREDGQTHLKIAEMQDQLDAHEELRSNLESLLSTTRHEADCLKREYDSMREEDDKLRWQLAVHETEIKDARQYISDLQKSLVTLESRLLDEQQKLSSIDNINQVLSSELAESMQTASQAIERQGVLEHQVQQLKSNVEESEKREREMKAEVQELSQDNARLTSDVTQGGDEIQVLRTSLENVKKSSQETITNLKLELESKLKMASEKNAVSSKDEYRHLDSQLKPLLMGAEKTDNHNQKKVEVSSSKQAAGLENPQLKEMEIKHQKTLGILKH